MSKNIIIIIILILIIIFGAWQLFFVKSDQSNLINNITKNTVDNVKNPLNLNNSNQY